MNPDMFLETLWEERATAILRNNDHQVYGH